MRRLRRCGAPAIALVIHATLAGTCAAADGPRPVSFNWPKPTVGTACELQDPDLSGKRQALKFAGTVERNELGVTCTVQMPRRKFDSLYRFCTVTNVDAVPREHYACWVMYSPTHVTFLYSYTDDYYGPPACEFECSAR
jgi:hypothetical protein